MKQQEEEANELLACEKMLLLELVRQEMLELEVEKTLEREDRKLLDL